MAVTPNYGWPVPVATDYVKDGWEAISDLGNAIDTTVAGLGSGLKYITGASFSASSVVEVNGCFNSTYDNYRFVMNITSSSASNQNLFMQLRVGTTDTTTNYSYGTAAIQTNGTINGFGQTGTTAFVFNYLNTFGSVNSVDIMAPNKNTETFIIYGGQGHNSASYLGIAGGGRQDSTNQFTGFKFFAGSGTITGYYRLYGYQNS